MKKLICFAALIFTSCGYVAHEHILLIEVRGGSDSPQIKSDKGLDGLESTYEDSLFYCHWTNDGRQFYILFENKTDREIKILWNEVIYRSVDSLCQRIINRNMLFSDCNFERLPGIVPPHSRFRETIAPCNLYLNRYLLYAPNYASDQKRFINKTLSLLMPMEISGKRAEIEFIFKILPP